MCVCGGGGGWGAYSTQGLVLTMYTHESKDICTCTYHGEERNGSGCMVVDGNEIHEEGSAGYSGREERSTHHHLFDPLSTCSASQSHRGKHSFGTYI